MGAALLTILALLAGGKPPMQHAAAGLDDRVLHAASDIVVRPKRRALFTIQPTAL